MAAVLDERFASGFRDALVWCERCDHLEDECGGLVVDAPDVVKESELLIGREELVEQFDRRAIRVLRLDGRHLVTVLGKEPVQHHDSCRGEFGRPASQAGHVLVPVGLRAAPLDDPGTLEDADQMLDE